LVLKRHFKIALCIQGVLARHPVIGAFSFHELLSAVASRIHTKGYTLDIIQAESSFARNAHNAMAGLRQNDAVLFLGWQRRPIRKLLQGLNLSIPYMVIDADLNDERLNYSCTDMARSTERTIAYFLKRDHERIALVRGEASRERFMTKLRSYKQIAAQHGLSVDPRLIFQDAKLPFFSRGYAAARRLLSLRKKPTAIFCTDNVCALGLVGCLKERGIGIPRDMEVIGFGDGAIADLCDPPISFVRRPIKEMALASINQVLSWLERESAPLPCRIVCREELVHQGTTVGQRASGDIGKKEMPGNEEKS
jgi:DNA-binding LacI/PurR family transcriptional regulator